MTAISASNLTEISMQDFPSNCVAGTAQRRAIAHIRCTTGAASDTLNLATYEPNIADLLGVCYQTLDGKDVGTAALNTWSTSTITFAGHAGSGVWEVGYVVRYT